MTKAEKYAAAKVICKTHGLKGFRKIKLVSGGYRAGTQCQVISAEAAQSLITELQAIGVCIDETSQALGTKGMLDMITIR